MGFVPRKPAPRIKRTAVAIDDLNIGRLSASLNVLCRGTERFLGAEQIVIFSSVTVAYDAICHCIRLHFRVVKVG